MMITPLQSFEKDLMKIIGKPADLRPFVCDGSPLECDIFIVGLNPATKMSDSFWNFWDTRHGFNKQAWFEAYKRERRAQPLKPGRTRRNEVSSTRRIIERILSELPPRKVLETNIVADEGEHGQYDATKPRPLEFLLKTIKPAVIVAHGKKAHEYIAQAHIKALSPQAAVFNEPHFSRYSHKQADVLAQKIKTAL